MEEVGHALANSIRSEKSELGMAVAMGARDVDALPLCVYQAYEVFLTLRAPRSDKSAERPSKGGFEGIEKVFAAVGLGGAAQSQPTHRSVLSRDLFENPNGAKSRRSSVANERGDGQEGINQPSDALVHEKSMAEGDKEVPHEDLPFPFPGFGLRGSSEQEQIPFPPSPAVGHDVDEEGEEEEEEEEEEINHRSSGEPDRLVGQAMNTISFL